MYRNMDRYTDRDTDGCRSTVTRQKRDKTKPNRLLYMDSGVYDHQLRIELDILINANIHYIQSFSKV
jgi:hypothetical protein